MKAEDYCLILLSVILVAGFISFFFFTYVAKVEEQILQNEMEYVIQDLTGDLKLFIPDSQSNLIRSQFNPQPPDMKDQDEKVAAANELLKKKAIKVFGTVFLVGMSIILTLWAIYKFDILHILKLGLIILTAVASTEFLFTSQIAGKYRILDPNFVRYSLIKNLRSST